MQKIEQTLWVRARGRMAVSMIALGSYGLLGGCAAENEDLSAMESESSSAGELAQVSQPELSPQWIDPPAPTVRCSNIPKSTNCSAPLAPGVERVCRIGPRAYTVRAGKTYDPCKPAALVIDIPNPGESAATQLGHETFCLGPVCWTGIGSGWAAESDTPTGGFIVVVPTEPLGIGEVASNFHATLVNEIKRVAPIDPERVYVSGLGGGADAAIDTACRKGQTFKGLSANSGGFVCDRLEAPMPAISFTARTSPQHSAHRVASERLARQNDCRRGPVAWRRFDGSTHDAVCRTSKNDPRASLVPCAQLTNARLEPTTCQVWTDCKQGAEVVLCEVAPNTEHGPLNAPVDGFIVYQNNTNLNTPSVAWRFFQQFAP